MKRSLQGCFFVGFEERAGLKPAVLPGAVGEPLPMEA